MWFTTQDTAGLSELDPASGEVEETIDIGGEDSIFFEGSVAVGEGAVWITDPDAGTLLRVDPSSGEVEGDPIRLPEELGAGDVAVGGQAVWVRSDSDGSVIRVDPDTNEVVGRPISAGSDPSGRVVIGFDSAWVTQSDGDTVTRLEF